MLNESRCDCRYCEERRPNKDAWGISFREEGERDRELVSQKMRELGRLLQQLMVVENNELVQLSDFIKPEKFDIIIKAVRETTGFMPPNRCQQEVNIPSH